MKVKMLNQILIGFAFFMLLFKFKI